MTIRIVSESQKLKRWHAARYRFEFEVVSPVGLPEYAGSMIRGVFGRALRRTTCMTHKKECESCPLARTCPYTTIFERMPPQEHALQKFSRTPSGYVVEPPAWGRRVYQAGETLSFDMVLFGHAVSHLPIVIYALQTGMLRDIGHGTARLARVLFVDQDGTLYPVYRDGETLIEHEVEVELPGKLACESDSERHEVVLEFSTPLRLQNNGRILGSDEIVARTILMSLVRRISLLEEMHSRRTSDCDFKQLSILADEAEISLRQLKWMQFVRLSSRQNCKMTFGGLIGSVHMKAVAGEFLPFLWYGQWTHVGKESTFGFGKYTLSLL